MSLNLNLTRSLTKSPALVYGAAPQVNLLPAPERDRRERAEHLKRWAGFAGLAVVVVVLVSLVIAFLEHSANADLDSERARTNQLTTQLARYHDVSAAVSATSSYQGYRAQAMAQDVSWQGVLGALEAALPKGAAVSGFDAVVGDGPAASTDKTTGTTVTPPSGTQVTVTLTVVSKKSVDLRTMVDGLSKVPGVLGVDLGELSSDAYPVYSSTTSVFLDGSIFTGQYAKGAGQ